MHLKDKRNDKNELLLQTYLLFYARHGAAVTVLRLYS